MTTVVFNNLRLNSYIRRLAYKFYSVMVSVKLLSDIAYFTTYIVVHGYKKGVSKAKTTLSLFKYSHRAHNKLKEKSLYLCY